MKLLSLDGETGRTLFETGGSFCKENSIVLAYGAHIVRHDISQENVEFDGDFSRDKQIMSIPFSLQYLSECIIEGSMSKSMAAKQTASNINQLLKLNSVKTKRR